MPVSVRGDLSGPANAIACSVGGATTIEDPRGRNLAYSGLPHPALAEAMPEGLIAPHARPAVTAPRAGQD
jgi:hypothetical protein